MPKLKSHLDASGVDVLGSGTNKLVSGTGGVWDGSNRVYSDGNKVPVSGISTSSGTASNATFLRGDGQWHGVVTGIIAGTNVTVSSQTGNVTVNAATPANMVTTDTVQTITGNKYFDANDTMGGGNKLFMRTTYAATSTINSIDSPRIGFITRRWTGTAAADEFLEVYAERTSAAVGALHLRVSRGISAGGNITTSGQIFEGANRVYSAANPPPASTPSNMLTTDNYEVVTSSKDWNAGQYYYLNQNTVALRIDPTTEATSGATLVGSPNIIMSTKYWSGSASTIESSILRLVRNSTTAGDHYWNFSSPVRATELFDGSNRVYSAANKVPVSGLSATGTASATTYLRGDGTWSTPAGGSTGVGTATAGLDLNVSPLASPPANPTVGDLWIVSDASAVAAAYAVEPYILGYSGSLTTQTGASRVYLEAGYVIESVRASVGTAPAGASVIVDVNLNGTSIYGTQANRPTIIAGANTGLGGAPTSTSISMGQYLTVDIDQVGSTTAGSDLTVVIRLRRA